MHIAICDDNVADRKQLERLLGREEDKRKAYSGVFYTDSYGNSDGLFPKRMSYDLFFIDIVNEEKNGLELAINLCKNGVQSPIVLCSSKIFYESLALDLGYVPGNLLFINKPILKADLSLVLDQAVNIEANKEPTIELRHKDGTNYVHEDDILYAKSTDRYVEVTLKNGNKIEIMDNLYNFYKNISCYSHFACISNTILINIIYVKSHTLLKITMNDGSVFNANFTGIKSFNRVLELQKKEKET